MKTVYETEYLQLGLKIAYYRKLRGLTQEQLAERLGVSNKTISLKLKMILRRASIRTMKR